MGKNQASPLRMVANELAEYVEENADQIEENLIGLIEDLCARCSEELHKDVDSDSALRSSRQYKTITDLVLVFGKQLLAYEESRGKSKSEEN